MGVKGKKHTEETALAADYLKQQLDQIEGITTKKMFGGYGFFQDKKIFGVVSSEGRAYFKVDETNRAQYDAAGSEQFFNMQYFSVPEHVLEDADELVRWARLSIDFSK